MTIRRKYQTCGGWTLILFFIKMKKLNELVSVVLFEKFVNQRPVMLLVLILGFLHVTAAKVLIEKDRPPSYNCSRVFFNEETTTEPSPTFPTTSFTCWGRYDGYYADVEVDCTIFHYCQTWQFPSGLNETVKWDFACPQSTIFNQKILSCTPPNVSFDCQESPNYYWVNYNLTSTVTTPTSTPELTTPVTNYGQQLIVGGLESKSVFFSDSTYSAVSTNAPSSPDSLLYESESRSAQPFDETLNNESDSDSVNFPL